METGDNAERVYDPVDLPASVARPCNEVRPVPGYVHMHGERFCFDFGVGRFEFNPGGAGSCVPSLPAVVHVAGIALLRDGSCLSLARRACVGRRWCGAG